MFAISPTSSIRNPSSAGCSSTCSISRRRSFSERFRAAPIVLLLTTEGPLAAADIAKALKEPHQLVAQRLDALVDLKIVTRVNDAGDARRKLLKITLDQSFGMNHTIGRLRLSATAGRVALVVLPPSIEAIVKVPADSRTPQQIDELAKYFRRSE